MRYAALITLRCLDALHAAILELLYIVGAIYWRVRHGLVRYLAR